MQSDYIVGRAIVANRVDEQLQTIHHGVTIYRLPIEQILGPRTISIESLVPPGDQAWELSRFVDLLGNGDLVALEALFTTNRLVSSPPFELLRTIAHQMVDAEAIRRTALTQARELVAKLETTSDRRQARFAINAVYDLAFAATLFDSWDNQYDPEDLRYRQLFAEIATNGLVGHAKSHWAVAYAGLVDRLERMVTPHPHYRRDLAVVHQFLRDVY